MADQNFDVIVIGGGAKALTASLYLQAYGGMKVGIFERLHELGGSYCSLEKLSPGFIGDTHSSTMTDWYFLPLLYDFVQIPHDELVLARDAARLYQRSGREESADTDVACTIQRFCGSD